MTKALTNRPGLNLAIEGSFDGPADTAALKQRKFDALVRGQIWEGRHAADPNIPPPEQLEIAPEAQAAAVKKLFDEKFPPGTEEGAPQPPSPVVAMAPPKEGKGFIRRVIEALTWWELKPVPEKPVEPVAVPAPTSPPEVAAGPSIEEMTGRLIETMEVTDNDLRTLADARAQRVRDYFINEGKIAADRLFLAQGNTAAKGNKGPRVFLSLR
jgi:hypothetical protein